MFQRRDNPRFKVLTNCNHLFLQSLKSRITVIRTITLKLQLKARGSITETDRVMTSLTSPTCKMNPQPMERKRSPITRPHRTMET